MKCEEVQDILSEYLDGEIAEPWRKEWVEKHVASCAACRTMLGELKQVKETVHSLPAAAPPKAMAAVLAKEVEKLAAAAEKLAEDRRRAEAVAARSRIFRWATPALMAAAACVLALFVGFQVRSLMRTEEAPLTSELQVATNEPANKVIEESVESEAKAAHEDSLAPAKPGEQPEKAQGNRDLAMAAPAAAPAAPAPKAEAAPAETAPRLDDRMPPLVKKEMAREAQAGHAAGAGAKPGAVATGPVTAPPPARVEAKAKVEAAKPEEKPAPLEETKMSQLAVKPSDLEKGVVPPSIEPGKVITGMVERKTLLLRAEDLPAASAEVKGILSRYGAQVSKDLYDGATLEGAGARIRARVPGSRYQALLAELRTKKYLALERAKAPAKAAKPAPVKALSIPETVDLTIKFQVNPVPPAMPAKPAAK